MKVFVQYLICPLCVKVTHIWRHCKLIKFSVYPCVRENAYRQMCTKPQLRPEVMFAQGDNNPFYSASAFTNVLIST